MVSQYQGIQSPYRSACPGNHIHRRPGMRLISDNMDVPDSMAGFDYSGDNIVST
jgi:hypothetical protein